MAVSSKTYEYLVGWLSESIRKEYNDSHKDWRANKTIEKLGTRGNGYQMWIETTLNDLFEQFLCLGADKRVLVGDDGATLHAYNGAYFEQIGVRAEKFMAELVKRTLRALQIGSMYVQSCPEKIARAVVSTLTSSDEYLYKPDKRYIAFQNGIFDLGKRKPRAFDVKFNPYLVLDINYMDEKECYKVGSEQYGTFNNACKLWDDKLRQILPNSEVRDAFQQWCGSLLVDPNVYKREFVCYLVGPGANGKSVLANVISQVFGERYFSHFTPRQLFKDSDRGANIAALRGKLANMVDDLNDKDISGGDYKRFASGQAFEARIPYEKRPIQVFAPPMLCCGNEMPEQRDNSKGNERRQLILHTTTHSFLGEDQDPELTSKLTTDVGRMYIFHWIIKGYKKVVDNKGRIQLGQSVIDAMNRVMARSNSIRRWWDEKAYVAIVTPEDKDPRWRPLKSLYEEYVKFCQDEGSEPVQRKEISAFLRSKDSAGGNFIRRVSNGMEYCVGVRGYDTTSEGKLIFGTH